MEKLYFDFEDTIDEAPKAEAAQPSTDHPCAKRPRKYKEVVCRLWLKNQCPYDDATCNFLHRLEESKMPVCSIFSRCGECPNENCIYKHKLEDAKECISYNYGFCPNGARCRFVHKKLPGPAPPVEEVLSRQRQLEEAKNKSTMDEGAPAQVNHRRGNIFYAPRHLQGISRYIIIKSDNMENLQLSIKRGMWATMQKNEDLLNDAFRSSDSVILIFSVNATGHFQGCAKMKNFVGVVKHRTEVEWKGRDGNPRILGKNFYVQWIKSCELPFHKTRHLKNPYNENKPVQISRDCQELQAGVGYQLVSLILQQPHHPTLLLNNDNIDWDMERYGYVKFGL